MGDIDRDSHKLKKIIQCLIFGMIAWIVLLVIFWAGSKITNKITEKKEEKILLEAIKQIPNVNLLGDYWFGSTDCYSENSNKASCTAITFNVSKELCMKLEKPYLNQSDKSNSEECLTYVKIDFQGKPIKLYFGSGSKEGEYWVRAWAE